jgi:hypothetical protein
MNEIEFSNSSFSSMKSETELRQKEKEEKA